MEISQKLLAVMLAVSVTVGAALGLVWDVIRLLRALASVSSEASRRHTSLPRRMMRVGTAVLAFLTDVLFGVLCGLCAVLLLYYTNDGQLRLSAFGGMAVGFAAWQCSVGRLNDRMTGKIAVWLYQTGRTVGRTVTRPARAMVRQARRRQKADSPKARKHPQRAQKGKQKGG